MMELNDFSGLQIIVRTCAGREEYLDYLLENVPDLVVVRDVDGNAMTTFLMALERAGTEAALHLEDDILVCDGFLGHIANAVAQHQDDVIQFFSMGKRDGELGCRWRPGSGFSMNQCFYLPMGQSRDLHRFYPSWERKEAHPTGYDLMLADWLVSRRQRYWLHVPSLVQHRVGVSAISPRRSSRRQSHTFLQEW